MPMGLLLVGHRVFQQQLDLQCMGVMPVHSPTPRAQLDFQTPHVSQIACRHTFINSLRRSRIQRTHASVTVPSTMTLPRSNSASSPLLIHPCPPILNISLVSLGLSI